MIEVLLDGGEDISLSFVGREVMFVGCSEAMGGRREAHNYLGMEGCLRHIYFYIVIPRGIEFEVWSKACVLAVRANVSLAELEILYSICAFGV